MVKRKTVPVSLVVPDASPLLSLGRVNRLDVFGAFAVPIHIVDVVEEEARRPQNDLNGAVRAWLDARPNNVVIETTFVGAGLRQERERGLAPVTGNLGEIAVDEYATRLARQGDPWLVPLVLFEDPDILELRVARLKNVHLINTAALLAGLHELGLVEDGSEILRAINALRRTPMMPIELPARTRRIESTLRKAVSKRSDQ
jgi:hypothetical protein